MESKNAYEASHNAFSGFDTPSTTGTHPADITKNNELYNSDTKNLPVAPAIQPDHWPHPKRGSFDYNKLSGSYPLYWPSKEKFELWKRQQEQEKCIELCLCHTRTPQDSSDCQWMTGITYVCSRQHTGGIKKPHPGHWSKQQKRTPAIRGKFLDEQTHATGKANIVYTRLSKTVKQSVRDKLIAGLSVGTVLKKLRADQFSKANI
ncbi:hypothetical protein BDV98DRAFT_597125 [Pterulicium gracile]|uniref:Uncharacterized protein n=1 Tax=Pterulicium gracile TaxID=1884261 RepID=A0A5C3Q468_9AGAR|nr:hypothetical protein BDV98DRAFT_597125 [Pterula gracilis]